MTNCARQKRVRGQLVRVSRSRRAGLVFSVGRLHRSLRHVTPFRIVSEGAAVYLAAVLEYLCAEVLILANAIARHHRTARITPRHVLMAIQEDEDVRGLLEDVVLPAVLPRRHLARPPASPYAWPEQAPSLAWTCRFLDN